MRSSFLLTAFALLTASLTSAIPTASPAALPQDEVPVVNTEVAPPVHYTTNINIESDFLTKLEAMFRGEYVPPGYEHTALAERGDLKGGEDSPEATRNDLTSGKCGPAILIFARGTTQPGNIGDKPAIKFAKDLTTAIPGTIVQGVLPYPADVFGYLAGGSAEGAQSMASLVARAASQCPSAKIIMSGYSQGAQVVHKAAALLSTTLYKRISAIVLFGDPKEGDALPGTLNSKSLTICNDGDLICDGLPLPFGSHGGEEYEATVYRAVSYIKARQ